LQDDRHVSSRISRITSEANVISSLTVSGRITRLEDVQQEAIAAWAEYVATGFHVTNAEADAWLAQLQAGVDVEPPTPHD
jgi:predicted transcriptional regulator